jgi:hypothetical protein
MSKMDVVVYDLATKTSHRFGKMQINPLWLDNDTLAVAGVRPCQCDGLDYTGKGWAVSLSSGRIQRIAMTNTDDADVLY